MPPKKKGGRYTPKGGPVPKAPSTARSGRTDAAATTPARARAARKPAPPWFLVLIGVLWIAVGFVIALRVEGSWRILPALVFAVVGVAYLRAALNATMRRNETRWPDRH